LRLPERGKITIFNRSYYEEVLVARVHPEILRSQGLSAELRDEKAIWPERYRSIVDLETKRCDPDPTNRVRPVILLSEAKGLMAEKENHLATAENLLRRAVTLEATLPIAFGPPTIDQPTHELLGAFLLRHGRRTEARVEFQKALAAAPGRRLAEKGLQAASAGSERVGKQ